MKTMRMYGMFAPMIAIGCGSQGADGERGPAGEMGAPGLKGDTGDVGPSSLAVTTRTCDFATSGDCNISCGAGKIAIAAGPMTTNLDISDYITLTTSGQKADDPTIWTFNFSTEGTPSVTTSAVCFTPPP